MLDETKKIGVSLPEGLDAPLQLRIGIAAGEAFSCMVGLQLPYYTYFGQAVRDACEVCPRCSAQNPKPETRNAKPETRNAIPKAEEAQKPNSKAQNREPT
jgi:hypothetical protein